MVFFPEKTKPAFYKGLVLVMFLALAASLLAALPMMRALNLHALIIAMIIGLLYANSLRPHIPKEWGIGINFSARRILRFAIVLYGFRLTFQDIAGVGLSGVLVSVLMVALTFFIGYIVGTRFLKMDRDLSILTSAGAAICGAAAVLATEGTINAKPYKSVVAVATVVIFGTFSMFLYPFAYGMGWIPMSEGEMGIYIGGSVHEVAHVVGASAAINPEASNAAVIVKMVRVMMLAPFLVLLGAWFWRTKENAVVDNSMKTKEQRRSALSFIPWFAVYFIAVAGFNSLNLLPVKIIEGINIFDGFLLSMAMCALGMETNINKFKEVGLKPVYLALILFVWLIFGGFFITKGALSLIG